MSAMNRFSRRVVLCVLTFTWLAASTTASADDESQRLGRQRPAQQDADRPRDGSLEEGVPAPDFKLKSLDGKRDVQLVAYRGRQPVVLIFGSYTWPPFRRQADVLEKMYAEYKDRVAFFVVYLREAHPEDGRQSQANVRDGVVFNQPTEFAERLSVAAEMYSKLELSIPCVIDGMDNQVGTAYAAMPDRLYLIGLDGRIAFKGEKGPRGFKPEQLREFLDLYLLLLDVAGDKIRPAEDKD